MEESTNLNSPIQTVESIEEKMARLETENANLKEKNEILEEAHKEIVDQLIENEKNLAEAKEDAITDGLTGLETRKYFEKIISGYLCPPAENSLGLYEEDRREKIKMPILSLIFFDIDHFKNVNDTYGHKAGDEILKAVARTIKENIRGGRDVATRWGGEEMMLGMIGADEETAARKADFIREKISQIRFPDFPSDFRVTVSVGVASSTEFSELKDLSEAADSAMYKSKQNGRNQTTRFSELPKDN